jgi:hypothetical protein
MEGGRKFTALKFHRLCPFILRVKSGCTQGKELGSEEGRMMAVRLLESAAGKRR